MCSAEEPASVGEALAVLDRALEMLATTDAAALPTEVQAQALRALERAEARHTAARAQMLAAFAAQDGYEDDGHGSVRVWLKWQTRVTKGAAVGAVGWARRLAAHPVIAQALAAGEISASWAKAVCDWSERLPDDLRGDADQILAAAAAGGAELADLAGLAEQIYQRARGDHPDSDPDDGFDDRGVGLDITFAGAGRLNGDLTPGCAAALAAVLEALGKRAGPEDTRTAYQRRHDALEEACRRLLAAQLMPGRAGQPAQAQVHITLAQLRALPGASAAEAAWRAAAARAPGWLAGPDADAAACDATLAPVVTGHVDSAALDRLVEAFLTVHRLTGGSGATSNEQASGHGPTGGNGVTGNKPTGNGLAGNGLASSRGLDGQAARPCGCRWGGCTRPTPTPLPPATLTRLRGTLLAMAADVLSGPGGLAAWLRQSALADGPAATTSLPLDVPLPLDAGEAAPAIPAHLRRAVTARHPCCAFPGCDQPAGVCQIHHLIPRAHGGPTALHNLVPLCAFHHLTAIHRWGWTLTLHPDGTTTATSPGHRRTYHSHGPPTPGHSPPAHAA